MNIKTHAPLFIRQIEQVDNTSFVITWSDGLQARYKLNELQKRCPCAACIDEITGKRIIDEKNVKPDVRATRITSVGRYALRIQFTSGCSTGIYEFDLLHRLARELA
jgi:DUF971 family protein